MKVIVVENDEDLSKAFEIRRKVFVEEQNVPPEEEIDDLENESTHFLLLEQDDAIGAGRFRLIDDYGKVERICILKEKRKSGAGKAIMKGIEHYAKQQGIKKLKLNAQSHAIPFYLHLGYDVVSDEFLEAGIPHRTMEKLI